MKRHRFLFIVSLIILTDLSFCSQVNAKVILEVSKYYEIPFAVLQLARLCFIIRITIINDMISGVLLGKRYYLANMCRSADAHQNRTGFNAAMH